MGLLTIDDLIWMYSPVKHPKIPTMGNTLIVGFDTIRSANNFLKSVRDENYPWFIPMISITIGEGRIISSKDSVDIDGDYVLPGELADIKKKASLFSL
jgi:hypothetical protein